MRGRTVGFLGFGRIGQATAKCLRGFDVELLYHEPAPLAGAEGRYVADLVEMAGACDIMVVTCAGGDGTRGLVGSAVLEALGPEGLLVNVARGSVVREADLVAALECGALGAAALDVFAAEPAVPEALRSMEQVVLTPHIASATQEAPPGHGQPGDRQSGRPLCRPKPDHAGGLTPGLLIAGLKPR